MEPRHPSSPARNGQRLALRLATGAVILFVLLGAILPARGLFVVLRGDGPTRGLPVTIIDRAGIVIGVDQAPVGFGRDAILGLPGRPNAIVYRWLGGECDRATTISVSRDDGVTELLRVDTFASTSCTLEGLERSVVIEFREPIDPTTVVDQTNVLF